MCLKSTWKRCVYSSRLTLKTFFSILIEFDQTLIISFSRMEVGKWDLKRGGNSIVSNSWRDENLFTKICQCMQIHLLNTHTEFEILICKNVDVTNKKPILIAKFTKGAYGSTFSNYFFIDEFTFQLCTRSEKFACLTLIIRPREVKSSCINFEIKKKFKKKLKKILK